MRLAFFFSLFVSITMKNSKRFALETRLFMTGPEPSETTDRFLPS